MMSTSDIAEALESWALAVVPELNGSYDYSAAAKTQPLPDVMIEIIDVSTAVTSEELLFNFEQVLVHVWKVRMLLMVPPEPGDTATDLLTGFIDALQASVINDQTVGGRLPLVSKEMRGSFNPPFVQFDDGTRGRVATLELTITEPISDEED